MLVWMDATATRAVLARAPALTSAHVTALLAAAHGELEHALDPQLLRLIDLPAPTRAHLLSPEPATLANDLAWLHASGTHVLLHGEAGYPPLLAQITAAPPVLFVQGRLEALSAPQLAMVGSRNPTAGGRATARDFAAYFARMGLTITSGLAVGIDAAAHEGALLGGGATVAVCGTGLDEVYPQQHAGLAERVRTHGALVSEFPPRTPPARANFPRRNRLISGLSAGTLVVEAARESGSLLTAHLAAEQGREVFAIPGSIHNPLSRGCHRLIREGAKLVEEAADVLSELKFSLAAEALEHAPRAVGKPRALDNEYEMLLDALGFEPATIDSLTERTGLPGESVASMLLILELEGRVAPHPGGRYGRIP
jgi:DNA processing protein